MTRSASLLAHRQLGAGSEVVVLLHSLGADAGMWEDVARTLSGSRRVVVPDSRGHGRSPAGPVSVDTWTDDLVVLLDCIGADRVSLVGVSLGGIQAIAFAAAHPARVRALVVADSFVALPPEVARTKIDALAGAARESPMSAVADRYVADTFADPAPAGAGAVRRALAGMDPASYAESVTACFGVQITHLLADVRAATLVLWGDRDEKTPEALSTAIHRGITGSRYATVPDAGHLSNVDNPAAFAGLVGAFLDEVGAATGDDTEGTNHG